jgi:hypothetical protein
MAALEGTVLTSVVVSAVLFMVAASLAFQGDIEAVFMVTIITVTMATEAIEDIQAEEAIKTINTPLMEVTRKNNAPSGALFISID